MELWVNFWVGRMPWYRLLKVCIGFSCIQPNVRLTAQCTILEVTTNVDLCREVTVAEFQVWSVDL